MPGIILKAGLRAAAPLRRPPPLLRRQQAPKRTTTTNTPKTPPPGTTATPSPSTTIPTPGTLPPLPLWQRLGPLTTALSLFSRAQRARPWTTQFVSTLIVYFLGDLSAQRIRGGYYEPDRAGRALVIGAGAAIPSYTW
jgi:protein Mpv17